MPHLVASLKERVYSSYTVRILGMIGPAAKPALPDLMTVAENRSELNTARTSALSAMGQIKEDAESFVPRLVSLASKDKEDDVRSGALGALFEIGVEDQEQREAIHALTKDRNPDIARRAEIVLEKKAKKRNEREPDSLRTIGPSTERATGEA